MPLMLKLVYSPRASKEHEFVVGSTSNSALLMLAKRLLIQEQKRRCALWWSVDPVLFEEEKGELKKLVKILRFLIPGESEK